MVQRYIAHLDGKVVGGIQCRPEQAARLREGGYQLLPA